MKIKFFVVVYPIVFDLSKCFCRYSFLHSFPIFPMNFDLIQELTFLLFGPEKGALRRRFLLLLLLSTTFFLENSGAISFLMLYHLEG